MLTVTETVGDLALLTLGGRWRRDRRRAPASRWRRRTAAIDAALRERGGVPVQERVFGDLQAAHRSWRALARRATGRGGTRPGPSRPPSSRARRSGAGASRAIHVLAARAEAGRLVRATSVSSARVVEAPGARLLGLADVGRRAASRLAPDPAEEAAAAIDAAEELLAREGFSFRDVARTWFYLRDILDWYGPFNAVRNAAFRRMGLMGPGGDGADPGEHRHRGAQRPRRVVRARPRSRSRRATGSPSRWSRLHNRRQNEATEYGSAFARAMEVVLGDARYVFVSGTASIDDHGATVHVGDFEAQTRYTLEAVAALLDGAGRLAPRTSGRPRPSSRTPATAARSSASSSGRRSTQVPLVTTVADVCREDLLFELDAIAVVPLRGGGARR